MSVLLLGLLLYYSNLCEALQLFLDMLWAHSSQMLSPSVGNAQRFSPFPEPLIKCLRNRTLFNPKSIMKTFSQWYNKWQFVVSNFIFQLICSWLYSRLAVFSRPGIIRIPYSYKLWKELDHQCCKVMLYKKKKKSVLWLWADISIYIW